MNSMLCQVLSGLIHTCVAQGLMLVIAATGIQYCSDAEALCGAVCYPLRITRLRENWRNVSILEIG